MGMAQRCDLDLGRRGAAVAFDLRAATVAAAFEVAVAVAVALEVAVAVAVAFDVGSPSVAP